MIGVIADSSDHDVVREFFELFKTPWESYREGRQYDVLLCAGDAPFTSAAKLVVVYAGSKRRFDEQHNVRPDARKKQGCFLSFQGGQIPIFGDTVVFAANENCVLKDESSQECVGFLSGSGDHMLARIGLDLFREVRRLLTTGQPAANAHLPAVELHIAFLRNLITGCGISLVEIPPVPEGHPFVACLTHDVDHPSIRRHKWDHTMFGFLYRAVFGSLSNFLRGRMPLRKLLTNWAAALKLPFVHLGLAQDIWSEFGDRYLELEKGLASTFFVIPFKGHAGRTAQGVAPKVRAARYGAQDIAGRIQKLVAAGCEIGLHGLDAWIDSSKGREELAEVRRVAGNSHVGVRMHWLYYDQHTPVTLESAGAAYDSTNGYNETVGYRAGTLQAYKPLPASQLLELPLHVMDTALFYPTHLGLSLEQASPILSRMVDNAARFGGCLTINWHDRSLAPERLWDASYRELLRDLKSRGAWFATAGQAVAWFRMRRAATFTTDSAEQGTVRVILKGNHDRNLPGLWLRVHKARESARPGIGDSSDFVDLPFESGADAKLPEGVGK